MSRRHHVAQDELTDRRKNRHHVRETKSHRKNPCPHSPRTLDSATELFGSFERHPGRRRHNRWEAPLRWTEVAVDTDGFPLIVRSYGLEVDYTANGTDWFIASKHQIPAKDDGDPDADVQIIIRHIHGNLAYRYRVRAFGLNCKGAWSGYFVLGAPDDTPPAPYDVKITRASHGIKLWFQADEDNTDDELFSQDITHFVAELWTNPDFGPQKTFTAAASDDKFTATSHGFANGDPVMISRAESNGYPETTPAAFPGGVRPWRLYLVSAVTTNTFKLLRHEDAAAVDITSDGEGVVYWGLVLKERHIHRHSVLFRIDVDDFDEDTRFYGRVLSVADHRSKSAYIPATAPVPNDDPDATPTGLRPAWHRRTFVFTIPGTVTEGIYATPDRVDDDYRIRRVEAMFDVAPTGGATRFDIKKNQGTNVFDNDSTKMVKVRAGEHGGTSKKVVNSDLDRGDNIRVRCDNIAGTAPAKGVIIVICDRRSDGSTTDSGGGGGTLAMPTYVAHGATAAGTGGVTVALPAGVDVDDVMLLQVETQGDESVATPSGWAIVTGSPLAQSTNTRLSVFWRRYADGDGSVSLADPGDHVVASIGAIRGCIATGNPWDVISSGTDAASDTSLSVTGATTTVDNTLVVIMASVGTDTTAAQFDTWVNADLTSLTERKDAADDSGNGGAFAFTTGGKAVAGAYGATTATLATASTKAFMTIALKGSS